LLAQKKEAKKSAGDFDALLTSPEYSLAKIAIIGRTPAYNFDVEDLAVYYATTLKALRFRL